MDLCESEFNDSGLGGCVVPDFDTEFRWEFREIQEFCE